MIQPTNPVIEATARASELVYQTFDQIWNTMQQGREEQTGDLNEALNECDQMRKEAEREYQARLRQIDAMTHAIMRARDSSAAAASRMQQLVGTPPEQLDEEVVYEEYEAAIQQEDDGNA